MNSKYEPIDYDSTFWSRIKLLTAFIHTGSQKSGEVEAGGSIAKVYRVGEIIRCDIKYGKEEET